MHALQYDAVLIPDAVTRSLSGPSTLHDDSFIDCNDRRAWLSGTDPPVALALSAVRCLTAASLHPIEKMAMRLLKNLNTTNNAKLL